MYSTSIQQFCVGDNNVLVLMSDANCKRRFDHSDATIDRRSYGARMEADVKKDSTPADTRQLSSHD